MVQIKEEEKMKDDQTKLNKKVTTSKDKITASKKKENITTVTTTESDSESEPDQQKEDEPIKSNFLSECEKAFGFTCLYKALNLDKNKAQSSDSK
jgi:hypothetical protein